MYTLPISVHEIGQKNSWAEIYFTQTSANPDYGQLNLDVDLWLKWVEQLLNYSTELNLLKKKEYPKVIWITTLLN